MVVKFLVEKKRLKSKVTEAHLIYEYDGILIDMRLRSLNKERIDAYQ